MQYSQGVRQSGRIYLHDELTLDGASVLLKVHWRSVHVETGRAAEPDIKEWPQLADTVFLTTIPLKNVFYNQYYCPAPAHSPLLFLICKL